MIKDPILEMYELYDLVDKKNMRSVQERIKSYNVVDIALFLETLNHLQALAVFRILPKDIATEVFSFFNQETQEEFISLMTNAELTNLVENLYIDDVVDMVEDLPEDVVARVLKNVRKDRRDIINRFLQYKEDSAGSIMTGEFISVKRDMTVAETIEKVRREGSDVESIYTVYVTNEKSELEGYISVKNLLTNDPNLLISGLLSEDIISVHTDTDQEEVAKIISKYDLVSVPVLDNQAKLVGIVTIDDAVDVLELEATEDIQKIAAMTPLEDKYLDSSIFVLAKNRIGWLLFLMISATFTGLIIEKYEALLIAYAGLMAFVPMLTDTGGNAGSQSSTMIIRGISLGEIKNSDFIKVFSKELLVGLLTGIILAVVNSVRMIIMYPGEMRMSIVVSLTLIATVVMSKTIGGLLPIAAKALKMDPAVMAAPLITTIVDSLSLLVYFFFVRMILM